MTGTQVKGKGLAYLTGFDLKPKGRIARSLTLRSVPDPTERNFPQDMLTLYYGSGTTLKELSRVHHEAISHGQDLYQITVAVDVKEIILEFMTLSDLKFSRMLNLERASKEVLEKIKEYWWDYLKSEGYSDEWIETHVEWRRHRFVSDRPDLLERLKNEPEFKNLALIIYQVVSDNNIYKAATVLDPSAIREVQCKNRADIKVEIDESVLAVA